MVSSFKTQVTSKTIPPNLLFRSAHRYSCGLSRHVGDS